MTGRGPPPPPDNGRGRGRAPGGPPPTQRPQGQQPRAPGQPPQQQRPNAPRPGGPPGGAPRPGPPGGPGAPRPAPPGDVQRGPRPTPPPGAATTRPPMTQRPGPGGANRPPSPSLVGQRPGPPGTANRPPSPTQRPGPPQAGGGRAIPGRASPLTPPVGQRPGPPPPDKRPGPPGAQQPLPDPRLVGSGRAVYRADHRGQGVRVQGEGSDDGVSSSMMNLTIGSTASVGSGAESVQGDPSGIGSVGRGASRGRSGRTEIFRTRPESLDTKQGDTGDKFRVAVNYFKVEGLKQGWTLYQYRVDFAPEEDRTIVKKRLVRDHKEKLGNYIFDGTMLFTPSKYVQNMDQVMELTSKREEDGAFIQLKIRLVDEVYPTDYHYLQFFNIILRKCMEGLDLQLLGRNFFDPKANIKIDEYKLELWPGYVTSIRQHEKDILLCCEISNKILRQDTVLDQLKLARTQSRGGDFQTTAAKTLLGNIIITRYNNKTYRIDDILWKEDCNKKFPRRDGSEQTFVQYYMERYKIKISEPSQPLIVSMPKMADKRRGFDQPILLVPELCYMTGLSDEQRANFKLMKAVGEYTRTEPPKRVATLMKFAQRIHTTPAIQTELNSWQLKFSPKLEEFIGRTFRPEEILQGNNRKCSYKIDNADWGGAFRDFRMFNSVSIVKWAVVYAPREENETKQFVAALQKCGPTLGFQLAGPKLFQLKDNKTVSYVSELQKVTELAPQLIMTVIPNNKGDSYHAIKKICCIDRPTPSQVVTGTVLKKPKGMMSVATKVAIQMACKIGAEPWAVNIPLKDTMVIGYDSFHDSAQKGMAVGAVVASINPTMSRYVSSCTFHYNDEELINQMKVCVAKAIRKYQEENNSMPTRIIIYRDGVGDGQIEFVKQHEIKAIKQVFTDNRIDPKFTYIVVAKRINTRFFKQNGQPSNPPSGSVFDDVVTLPERYDFFLVSQSVRQGTVNPTSYNVIEDTSGLKPDRIQMLTYKLCHLYYNWPGTVRVPAPCQYAHKLATLVGQSLHKAPSPKLEHLLYYL